MRKRISVLLLSAALLLSALPAALADGTDAPDAETRREMDAGEFGGDAVVERDGQQNPVRVNGYPVRRVRAALNLRSNTEATQFDIWFADYPFYREATVYDGNLAVMSLAMALSAKRSPNSADGETDADFDPSLNLRRYLTDAGFTNIRQDDYSKETSMYTISTAMGSRRMEREGEEPFTLIAVGVCGGGYQNEWQSNMTPGAGDVHEGFQSAAQLVIDRLSGYIMTNGIEGDVKVWISGFSRAAAVSNLTAGFLTQYGMFEKEDVFAYTFATPAAVLEPQKTGYENIFNIMNPMDLIPQVMPYDWGYGRFGTDLFLPVTEFSSTGEQFTDLRAQKAREALGLESNYSPALNLRLRLLLSMILELVKNRDRYNERFQPAVVGIMQNRNASNLLATVRDLMHPLEGSGRESRESLDELIDYTVRVFGNVLTRTELAGANENTGNPFFRLFNEHSEDTYLACIDLIRAGMFDEDQTFTYVLIRGPVEVTLIKRDASEYRIRMTDGGVICYSGPAGSDVTSSLFYMERIGNTSVIAVPHNEDFTVEWEATDSGTVEVCCAEASVHASAKYTGAGSEPIRVRAGDTGTAYRSENGRFTPPERFTETTFDARQLATFIGIESLGVNWRIALTALCALIGLVLAVLLWLLVRLRKKHNKLGVLTWICLTVFCVGVMESEAAYWFFADATAQRMVWKGIVALALILLFIRYFRRKKQRLVDSVFFGFVLSLAADIVICKFFIAGALIFLLGHILLVVSFLRQAPMGKGRWIWWALLSIGAAALIVVGFAEKMGLPAWISAVYVPVLLLMYNTANSEPMGIRIAAKLFAAADVLLGFFFAVAEVPFIHTVYILLFYISMLLLAVGGRGEEPDVTPDGELIPEESAEEMPVLEAVPEEQANESKETGLGPEESGEEA